MSGEVVLNALQGSVVIPQSVCFIASFAFMILFIVISVHFESIIKNIFGTLETYHRTSSSRLYDIGCELRAVQDIVKNIKDSIAEKSTDKQGDVK